MQTFIKVKRCYIDNVIQEIDEFADAKIVKYGHFTKIKVVSEKETDIARVREIEKKYNNDYILFLIFLLVQLLQIFFLVMNNQLFLKFDHYQK